MLHLSILGTVNSRVDHLCLLTQRLDYLNCWYYL